MLREYLIDCRELRQDFPGLCALDYENVMRIVVEYFLGWDREKNCNKPDFGLFDDLLAYVIAAEEQARKTIHGHILIWLKNWSRLYKKLNSERPNL